MTKRSTFKKTFFALIPSCPILDLRIFASTPAQLSARKKFIKTWE